MAQEGFKLEKNEVREIINREVEKHDISITETEQQIIDNIVASCPLAPNTARLFAWCNKKVSEELDKYPDMNEDIRDIRNEVGKELRYKIDRDSFEEAKEIIKNENPETINPQWMRNHFSALYMRISKGYKTIDGSIDWDFVVKKLDISNKFHVKKLESWNFDKEKIINALNNLLEEKSPLVFGPDWLLRNGSSVYHQLMNNFRTEDDKIDWDTIRSLVDEKWQEKWKIQRRGISILEIVDNITRTFQEEKPEKISPMWLQERMENNYAALRRLLPRNDKKELDYQSLVDLLPDNIANQWKPFLTTEKIIPKETYLDIAETDNVIHKHKDKIYTFYTLIDKEKDKICREDIINDMREIIMKGNIDALDRLVGHLVFTVDEWIEDNFDLKVWQYAQEKVREIIKRCIYRHDPTKGKFSSYLYATLKKEAISIRINSKGDSFVKRYADGHIEYHEDEGY